MVMQNFDQNMLTCMGVLMGKSFGFEDGEGDAMDTKPDAAEEAPQAAEPKQAEPTPAPEASESEEAEPVDPEAAAAKVCDMSFALSNFSLSYQEKAAACKAKGTEAYKAKNFDEALKVSLAINVGEAVSDSMAALSRGSRPRSNRHGLPPQSW